MLRTARLEIKAGGCSYGSPLKPNGFIPLNILALNMPFPHIQHQASQQDNDKSLGIGKIHD